MSRPQTYHLCLVLELKSLVRKLENDTTDLKFLNNQYVHKVRCLEKDGKNKSERIQQLQEKNMQTVVQTLGNTRTRTGTNWTGPVTGTNWTSPNPVSLARQRLSHQIRDSNHNEELLIDPLFNWESWIHCIM